jgi:hypothetical protein
MNVAKTTTDLARGLLRRKSVRREPSPFLNADGGARGRVRVLALMGAAPACVHWGQGLFLMPTLGETANQSPRFAVNVLLKVGQ